MQDTDDKTTHFGARDVPESEKAGLVHGVFTSVASRYDVMNDLMSGGIHRIWKDAMMDWLAPRPGQRLLDVAGGTGDIAFRFLNRAGRGHATVLDLTEPMLIEGRKRADAEHLSHALDWVCGDAMDLPFGQEFRYLYDRFRHPERHPHPGCAERGVSCAEARRTVPVS